MRFKRRKRSIRLRNQDLFKNTAVRFLNPGFQKPAFPPRIARLCTSFCSGSATKTNNIFSGLYLSAPADVVQFLFGGFVAFQFLVLVPELLHSKRKRKLVRNRSIFFTKNIIVGYPRFWNGGRCSGTGLGRVFCKYSKSRDR